MNNKRRGMNANAWHTNMVAFDVESTGVSVDYDRIVTATVATISPGAKPVVWSWLINPGVPIPASATAVHGITTEQAQRGGCSPAEAIKQIAESLGNAARMGVPVIAFNAAYDFSMLDRACRRLGITAPEPLVVDPFILDKRLDKWRKGPRTLTTTCAHYRVALNGAHNATEDALAAGRLAWRMAQQFPAELQIPLEDLHTKQAMWRYEWAVEFEAYLRTKGDADAQVNGEWPVQSLPSGWSPNITTEETP